jgi:transcriptional regulator with XRE-family HTH domain
LVEAAKKTGVTRATLSELERGHRHPVAPTLVKIAEGYGVPVEELLEKEPALAGKAEAPEAAGPPDEAPEEKERQIIPMSPAVLKWQVERIKRIREERESEVEAVRLGDPPPRAEWILQLEAVDEHFERVDQTHGITAHVEDLDAGRELEEVPVDLPYRQFSRLRSDLAKLTDQANALARWAESNNIDVVVEKEKADLDRHPLSTSPEQRG